MAKLWQSGVAKNEVAWWHLSGATPSLIFLDTPRHYTIDIIYYTLLSLDLYTLQHYT